MLHTRESGVIGSTKMLSMSRHSNTDMHIRNEDGKSYRKAIFGFDFMDSDGYKKHKYESDTHKAAIKYIHI